MDRTTTTYLRDQGKKYEDARRALTIHRKMLDQHRYDLRRIELQTKADVAREKVPGTDKAIFTNETLRDAETTDRLRKNEEYLRLMDLIGHEEDEINDRECELDIIRVNLKVEDILSRGVLE